MAYIHKEGKLLLFILFIIFGGLLLWMYPSVNPVLFWSVFALLIILYSLVFQFFRNPKRTIPILDSNLVYAPADGKIVVIEEVFEPEYFKDKRMQVSVFMSPLNVHVNRSPIGGKIAYYRYHSGEYLVAWHPKASELNERSTIVVENNGKSVLFRQIAGALARRIKVYITENQNVQQGEEIGFIKFGSRVDLFLPLDATIQCKIGDVMKGNKSIIAKI